jgi:inorganic phosphate transporter, PiT family
MLIMIIALILLALLFDFLNGFNDSANSIATVVSTRVLTPRLAVIWAAFFNFISFLFFGTHVANTIGKGVVDISAMDPTLIFSALVGACIWNITAWYFGVPSSSSHALIGGMVGGALMKAGPSVLIMPGIIKIVAFIVISPLVGMLLGIIIGTAVHWIFRSFAPRQVDVFFRKGQLLSAALFSLGHGGNDAQKTMGIIWVLLIFATANNPDAFPAWMHAYKDHMPNWVVYSCQAAISLGTLFGGWRIVKTMGQRIAKLKPVDGFCAESGAATSIYISTFLGVPVSTTQTITGAIMGVGSLRRLSAVKWGVAGQIAWAWILTIPFSGSLSALAYFIFKDIIVLK